MSSNVKNLDKEKTMNSFVFKRDVVAARKVFRTIGQALINISESDGLPSQYFNRRIVDEAANVNEHCEAMIIYYVEDIMPCVLRS